MQRAFAVLILCIAISASGMAQGRVEELTPEKRADINSLMVMTGSVKIGAQLADGIMESFMKAIKSAKPDIPDRVFAIMRKEMMDLFQEQMEKPGGLVDQMIPIYNKYLTHEEVKGLLAFYRSDLGQKAIAVLPKMTGEAITLGQTWGISLGPEIERRIKEALKKEGIELPDK
jgi:hypothetical protein